MSGTITATQPRQRAAKPRQAAPAAPAAYNLADGACSLRHTLTARECGVLDRALAIVGRRLNDGRPAFETSDAVRVYFQLHLGGEPAEHFAVLFLDNQHRAVAFERMFTGTLTQTSVHPREVVRAALRHGAAAVVLGHNHPSGNTRPSGLDEALTQTLKQTLALVDVRVLDHIIVTAGGTLSMAERGLV